MILVSSCSCLWSIHWSQVLSREWRCSWLEQCPGAVPTGDALTIIAYIKVRLKWKYCHFDEFSALAALEAVILSTSSATSDENIKMNTFPFRGNTGFSIHFVITATTPHESHGVSWITDNRDVVCHWRLRLLTAKTLNVTMTSSNGNIFRVTGPLCEEFTGHR